MSDLAASLRHIAAEILVQVAKLEADRDPVSVEKYEAVQEQMLKAVKARQDKDVSIGLKGGTRKSVRCLCCGRVG